jgi:hypothetical protein
MSSEMQEGVLNRETLGCGRIIEVLVGRNEPEIA